MTSSHHPHQSPVSGPYSDNNSGYRPGVAIGKAHSLSSREIPACPAQSNDNGGDDIPWLINAGAKSIDAGKNRTEGKAYNKGLKDLRWPVSVPSCGKLYENQCHKNATCKLPYRSWVKIHSPLPLKLKQKTTGLKSQPISAKFNSLSSKFCLLGLEAGTNSVGAQAPRYTLILALYLCLHSGVYREAERLAGLLQSLSSNLVHSALLRLEALFAGLVKTSVGAAS